MDMAAMLSLIITVSGFLYIVWGLRVKNGISYRSAIAILIATVFTGLVIIEYPLSFNEYMTAYPAGNTIWIGIAAVFQSLQNALRTFVLDGSWSDLLPSDSGDLQISIFATVVGLGLNVIAPILTFSAIISLFKELTSKIRVSAMAASRRPLFLFSELNKDTVFLAEDIRGKYPKANLVYTDVYPENDEVNYELRERAGKLHALMLRTDISELNIKSRNDMTEYYLFGHDEEENVMQAKKLFVKNKDKSNTAIYVKSVTRGNELVIDSLTSSLDISENLRKAEANEWDYQKFKDAVRNGEILKIRRVDPEKQIAWREIPKMQCIKDAFAGAGSPERRILSLLIFADTHLSLSIVKTLLWYCQSDKFKLQLNIVFADDLNSQDSILSGEIREKVNVKSLLEFDCPDIIRTNGKDIEGEAFYDIEFIESAAFESGSFQMKLIGAADRTPYDTRLIDRLAHTNAVIIDRGSDGATLETAAFMRTTFERLKIYPEIYAVCADEEEILKDINTQGSIVTYKDENYDIRFIGKRSDTYILDNIRNTEEENLGFCQHIKWIDVSYSSTEPDMKEESLKRELLNYERHEYFRNSSIVKAMYLRNVLSDPDQELAQDEAEDLIARKAGKEKDVDDNTRFEWRLKIRPEYECLDHPREPKERWKCTCAKCRLRRELEHKRWNAYMRTEGYIASPDNNIDDKRPMAKVHGNLVPFSEIKQEDRDKDG